MASPTPVPSKAALHALRGLIFGTSCSLVLLAEERRRRIGIARAAVENGRKLRSLKCYSSAATAALDNIREDSFADSKHLTWRPTRRRKSQTQYDDQHDDLFDEKFNRVIDAYGENEPRARRRLQDHGQTQKARDDLFDEKINRFIDAHGKSEPRTRHRLQDHGQTQKAHDDLFDEKFNRLVHPHGKSGPRTRHRLQDHGQTQKAHDDLFDEKFNRVIDAHGKSEPRTRHRLQDQGQTQKAHERTPEHPTKHVDSASAGPPVRSIRWASPRANQQITPSLNNFLESSSKVTQNRLRNLGFNLHDEMSNIESPDAALQLIRRACDAVPKSPVLRSWLCELSQHLCRACQNEGHHLTAGRILNHILNRGPITLEQYLAHNPKDLICGLLRRSAMDRLNPVSLLERLRVARQIILANDPDGAEYDWRSKRGISDLGRDVVERLALLVAPAEALSTLRRLHNVCHFGLGTYAEIVRTFYEVGYHLQALDAFVDLSKFGPQARLPPGRLIYQMFHSLSETGGHAALKVLDTMRILCFDSLEIPNVRNASLMLWDRWNQSRDLDQVDYLSKRILAIVGTDDKRIYSANTYALHSAMIEIQLEAGNSTQAQETWVQLRDKYDPACRDIKLQGRLALGHARLDSWGLTRSLLEDMHELRPFNQTEEAQHAETWQRIFIEYGKKHTWSELEEFIEGCVKTGGAPLHRETIDKIVQRLGACRSYKRLRSWLRFCQSQDYTLDKAFWVSLFTTAREDWAYRTPHLVALYSELQPCLRESAEYDGISRAIERLLAGKASTATTVYLMKPSQVSEEATFRQMSVASHEKRWSEVLGAYRAAVGNGLGFSSRCLRLAVLSCIQTEGTDSARHMLRQARAQGYDVNEASTPVDLAMLGHLEAHLLFEHATGSGARPSALDGINQVLRSIREDGRSVEDIVFDKAAQVCLSLRNYKEAIVICLKAAEANGAADICYSVFNFANLSAAFVAQHDYGRLRSLFKQMLQKHWRTGKLCRRSIETTISYLVSAAKSDKEERLVDADAEMIDYVEDAFRSIKEDKANLEAQVWHIPDMASDSDAEQ